MLINNTDYKSLNEVILSINSEEEKGITFITGDQDEKFISYKQLYIDAVSVLYILQEKGVMQGQEVVFQLGDNQQFVTFFWACILGRIIPVPVTLGSNEEQKLKVCRVWKCLKNPVLITDKKAHKSLMEFLEEKNHKELKEKIEGRKILIDELNYEEKKGIIYDASPDDIAFIQFSSGSTGNPKGVILTHGNLLANVQGILIGVKGTEEDSTLSWMPLTHDMGLIAFHITPLSTKMNQYIMPTSVFIRRPTLWLKKTNEHKATILSSPNFGYQYFMKFYKESYNFSWNLSKVRVIVNGAEPISSRLCIDFLNLMNRHDLNKNVMFPVYGLAEASVAVTFTPIGEGLTTVNLERNFLSVGEHVRYTEDSNNSVTLVDVGYPVKNCCIRICNGENQEVGENIVGYIQIKGENVTRGYYNNKIATAETINTDGWLNTRDLGFIRNGRLIITGRAKDIIFVNGANYYSHDLEHILEEVEGLELGKIAVGGVYNAVLEEEEILVFVIHKNNIKQFVKLSDNVEKTLIRQLGLKIKEVIPVNKLPKTTSGKVQRFKLIEKYKNGEYTDLIDEIHKLKEEELEKRIVAEPKNETERKFLEICKEIFKVNKVGVDDNFIEMGADSILLSRIYSRIEEIYPGRLSISDFYSYPTISQLANYLSSCRNISPLTMNLEKEYFNGGWVTEEKNSYEFKLTGEIFEKIQLISKAKKIKESDLLLAIFLYMVSNISQTKKISIQTMLEEEDTIIPLTIDFNNINDFTKLFSLINRDGKERNASYKLSDINMIYGKRTDMEIALLFYSRKLLNRKLNLLDLYDINVGFDLFKEGIKLTFEYNNLRLRKEKMKELFSMYANIITTLVNKL